MSAGANQLTLLAQCPREAEKGARSNVRGLSAKCRGTLSEVAQICLYTIKAEGTK